MSNHLVLCPYFTNKLITFDSKMHYSQPLTKEDKLIHPNCLAILFCAHVFTNESIIFDSTHDSQSLSIDCTWLQIFHSSFPRFNRYSAWQCPKPKSRKLGQWCDHVPSVIETTMGSCFWWTNWHSLESTILCESNFFAKRLQPLYLHHLCVLISLCTIYLFSYCLPKDSQSSLIIGILGATS